MTIRARKPAASARSTSERVIAGSACVYSWNQRVPPGAPAATASIEWEDVVDSVYGIPAAAAAAGRLDLTVRMGQRLERHRRDRDRERRSAGR